MSARKRITSLVLTLMAVFGIAGLASAQMMGHGMMGGQGMMSGLTPAKQAVVQKAYADFNAATASLRQQLTAKQYELEAQIVGDSPDDKKVQSLTKDVSDLSAKLFKAQVDLQGQLAKLGLPSDAMDYGMGMHHTL